MFGLRENEPLRMHAMKHSIAHFVLKEANSLCILRTEYLGSC